MANPKPKKTAKKSSTKPEVKKETREAIVTPEVSKAATCECPGFFARKCDKDENVLTIFKTKKIWGALLGELVGTMLMVMLLLTLTVVTGGLNPLYLVLMAVGIYVAVVKLSGAHLNPLVTVGAMVTRRVSAIRGVLYMLAQVLGAWLGLIILNSFRLGGASTLELPMMDTVDGETFWAVALTELLGAIVIAYFYARGLKYARKNVLAFAFTVTTGIALAALFGILITQGFFGLTNGFVFNPAAALMYQILPTTAEGFGELAGMAGMAVAAYVIVPMIGGALGFCLSDLSARLAGAGYFCPCDDECCGERGHHA